MLHHSPSIFEVVDTCLILHLRLQLLFLHISKAVDTCSLPGNSNGQTLEQ